jgi:hypothetical protein
MPLTAEQRHRNEASIRAAMDRLFGGNLPPHGGCDLKTLAREARVPRTGFYSRTDTRGNQRPGPYQHLADEFQRRLAALRETGTIPDPRELQITKLKPRTPRSASASRHATSRSPNSPNLRNARYPSSLPSTRRSSASVRPPTRRTTSTTCPPPGSRRLPDHAAERRPTPRQNRGTKANERRPQVALTRPRWTWKPRTNPCSRHSRSEPLTAAGRAARRSASEG